MRLSSRSATVVAIATLCSIGNVLSFQAIHPTARTQHRWLPEQQVKVLPHSPVSSQVSFSRSSPSRANRTFRYAADLQKETDPSPNKSIGLQQFTRRLSLLRMYARRWLAQCRRTVTSLALSLLVVFACYTNAAWAVSGGRMGGSFGATSRSSHGSYGSSMSRNVQPSRYHYNVGPRYNIHTGPSSGLYGSFGRDNFPGGTSVATRFSPHDIALLGTVTIVFAVGFSNNRRRNGESSPLGPGATVASLTLSLNAQNRNDPDCVLNRLKSISEKFDTSQRKGVQDLVSEVALELLRQEDNIVSAQAQSQQFPTVGLAEREFQQQSVQGRSKLDRETVNKFGSVNQPDQARARLSSEALEDDSGVTNAVVSVKLSIEGDSTRMPKIVLRQDLRNALQCIAADAQVEDCLISAEILWSPEESTDRLTADDIYASYPDLIPL